MGLIKSKSDRFEQVAAFVTANFGVNAGTLVRSRINTLPAIKRAQIGSALSLGARSGSDAAEDERRNALRTLIFLLLDGGQPTALAPQFKSKYETARLPVLKVQIKNRLPLLERSNLRDEWDQSRFTRVAATGPAPNAFRYLVFGMMNTYTGRGVSYQAILKKPDMLKTFLLSTSVIDQNHVPTYYPYGAILRVPADCVVSTSRRDQAFKNYKVQDPQNPMKPCELTDMTGEIRRVAAQNPLRTPASILKETRANGDFGYNEIVVMGTAPGGASIEVEGWFMKVDSDGKRYVRKDNPLMGRKNESSFVTDEIHRMMRASGRPIVSIRDPSGAGG